MAKYWISVRGVDGGVFTGDPDLGTTRFLKIPDAATPLPSHAIPRAQWIKEVLALFPLDPKSGVPTGDLLFFVHGYNDSAADVDVNDRKVQAGLVANGFSCPLISFDWPSGTDPLAYLPDRKKAKETASRLVDDGIKLFAKTQTKPCDVNLHVLAHSTGAYVIREAFDSADDTQMASASWMTNQLAFIAGDISSASLSDGNPTTASVYQHCYRLTNYSNGFDEVLQISNAKRIGLAPRVGRVGLPGDAPQKAVNVDCSTHYKNTYPNGDLATSHSWYFDDKSFLKDLTLTLRGAIDRNQFPTRATAPGGGLALTN